MCLNASASATWSRSAGSAASIRAGSSSSPFAGGGVMEPGAAVGAGSGDTPSVGADDVSVGAGSGETASVAALVDSGDEAVGTEDTGVGWAWKGDAQAARKHSSSSGL